MINKFLSLLILNKMQLNENYYKIFNQLMLNPIYLQLNMLNGKSNYLQLNMLNGNNTYFKIGVKQLSIHNGNV